MSSILLQRRNNGHSGEKMVAAAWSTQEIHDIQDWIIAVMMDNASKNDALVEALKARFCDAGIKFRPSAARKQCIPCTIDLAAIRTYFASFSTEQQVNAAQFIVNLTYQDDVDRDLDWECDPDATQIKLLMMLDEGFGTQAANRVKVASRSEGSSPL
ncbi:hypothetical protein GALMADRAFT_144102 [Galerina marginata CBS 339.88]|uniref:Uncharacterized protein n=1 Tax=Galerina marginata (strain CBS 339.88) TaxID=685588 RepID=A0A067SLY1_GALM3|nr:hypothetical protein GALMADRAFT_144102 [Galerina marginata CBS 339.88]